MLRRKIKLWKEFCLPLSKVFLLSFPIPIFTQIFWGAVGGLFSNKGEIDNYAELFPAEFTKKSWFLDKWQFTLISILLVISFFLVVYFYELQSRKLIIKIVDHLKNRALEKFRHLPLEERLKRKGEINNLATNESEWVGYYWVNFWRNLFRGSVGVGVFLYKYFKSKKTPQQISNRTLFFTLFWLFLISGVVYLFYKINSRFKRKSKQAISQEREIINQEVSHSILISSMGLEEDYKKQQLISTSQSARAKVLVKKLVGLEMEFPWKLLLYLFPFILLIIEPSFIGVNLALVWNSLSESAHNFGYLANWSEYTTPRFLFDKFLTLPEKDDNLKGIKLSPLLPVKEIIFDRVSFKYQGSSEQMNYNATFPAGKINYLSTPNGSGKTTQLYLLLGLLAPVEGKIIIKSKETDYKLSELNLNHWRSKNLAFCSYQTLIKEGSAGQKQLANLKRVLQTKKEVQVFIFDEADNALDEKNSAWFQNQLKKLVMKNKIVIYVKQIRKE
ncbi:MAG: ABC transporter ATP-binding protein [Mycoplasmataceae bacterium RC_NB112A]|nr:MAG: ABC transporter ATP-binding protein [Mycoplasmataceae bacterium RC_NB112A]